MSDNKADKRVIYTIMADFGTAYGWIKEDGRIEESYVGPCHANSDSWRGAHEIPKDLHSEFVKWQNLFENEPLYDDRAAAGFDWNSFNKKGLELCRELKAFLGENARVCYQRASEENLSEAECERYEILADGSIKAWKLQVPKELA